MMRREVTSRSIQGISDLVVRAPIRRGFIDAFENVTYETRLRLATRAFNDLRVAAREYEPIRPFADVAERIQSLLAFRIGVIDTQPQPSLILAATFDRAWEPYIRQIWRPLGVFLDVLLCNCEGYVTAGDHDFPQYAQWVRDHQVDSDIFYAATPLTVSDQLYMIRLERLQREGGAAGSDRALAGMTADDPVAQADRIRGLTTASAVARGGTEEARLVQQQFLTLAGEALVVLYRLADYYPPDRPGGDGVYLRRAARNLFEGWNTADPDQLPTVIRRRFAPMFDWLEAPEPPPAAPRPDPALRRGEVQGGILSGYDRKAGASIKHGALLMFSVTDAGRARAFIGGLMDQIAWENDAGPKVEGKAFLNIALTHEGLARLGVPAAAMAAFPKEFRDGVAARATLMGDIGPFHPRNWKTLDRFAPAPGGFRPGVELSEVDFILQLRIADGGWSFIDLPGNARDLRDSPHPLASLVLRLREAGAASGAMLVSVQPMRRMNGPDVPEGSEEVEDHFGFADLISQPILEGEPGPARDVVGTGELLLGYANDRGDPAPAFNRLLANGSFLVIRKMSQDVEALRDCLENPPGADPRVRGDDLLARIVGRRRDGTPLIAGASKTDNDFDYSGDPSGAQCPLQAHIRRANPRHSPRHTVNGPPPTLDSPTPRLMRRGMSYGPTVEEDADRRDRGIVFMAYCASLAEQFETIQRWINGGASTAVSASQNDPLIGCPAGDGRRTFRFIDGEAVARIDILKPFAGLEWSLYLFAPSRTALAELAAAPPTPAAIGDPDRGEAILARLAALPEAEGRLAWKTRLEDFLAKDPAEDAETPDIWAAIRERRGGALRTPAGVLAASDRLVKQVLLDAEGRYSVSGQAERMRHAFGEIYIGLDPGPRYDRESSQTNAAIASVGRPRAFAIAHEAARRVLELARAGAAAVSGRMGAAYPEELDLRRDFIAPALGLICKAWFGLPDLPDDAERAADPAAAEHYVALGDWSFAPSDGRAPLCPGDFMAPSRYCFYPDPTDAIADYGRAQGQALRAAARRYLDAVRPLPPTPPPASAPRSPGPLTQAMMAAIPADNDLLARTLIGVMVGALPPLDGNLRAILYEWLRERNLWRLQRTLLAAPSGLEDRLAWAERHLEPAMKAAMQKRPAPDLLWRTAVLPHALGDVAIQPGDKVILGLVSATQETWNAGLDDVAVVFGGLRREDPHPVHACPAHDMAMATMMGMLTALLEAGGIEALPQPLLVRITPPPG